MQENNVTTPAAAPSRGPTGSPVEASGLTRSYGDVRALDGVDLHIAPGEVVALLGPNGAGKSTLVDVLLGLAAPDAGTVRVFGAEPRAAVAGGCVGAMLQTGELLGQATVREVVELIGSLHGRGRDAADAALAAAGVTDLAGRRTHRISGGEAQRVRFAQALVGDPDLLVLDEPTTGMDVAARTAFWDAVRGQARAGRTVLFATHYLAEADAEADRIVLLADGRVVADGSVTEIRAASGGQTVRATLPGADTAALAGLPGVTGAEQRGDTVVLHCSDSDAAVPALFAAQPHARHVEVAGADLTEAFLRLTREGSE